MSAFLGPIHTWLYNKIKFQDAMVDAILDLAEENGWVELRKEAGRKYGELGKGNLEDMIDTGNIHGWLQEKVSMVENRMAFVVTSFAGQDEDRFSSVKEAILRFGEKNPLDKDTTPREAYDYLESTLLNGMPCDRVNELVQDSPEKLVWRQTTDIHAPYWDMIHGDAARYQALRVSLIQGMLKDSAIEFGQAGDQEYELRRRLCTE
ncbi:MAG: hypothetical protein QM683_16350 [Lacrimispora sp.]